MNTTASPRRYENKSNGDATSWGHHKVAEEEEEVLDRTHLESTNTVNLSLLFKSNELMQTHACRHCLRSLEKYFFLGFQGFFLLLLHAHTHTHVGWVFI